jgi:ATP-dependent protease ClpP protease subunit
MPAKTLRVFPGRASLIIHPPIETRGMTGGQVDELLHQAEQVIASALPPSPR